MPLFLVEKDLKARRLICIAGDQRTGGQGDIVAARLRTTVHGLIAERPWRYIADEAAALTATIPG